MDFRHVRAFIAVAEESSITRAAARLHISQPPLSRLIRQLEDELGVTLFLRHRQGVTLTDAGRGLVEKARTLASAASDFLEAAGHATHDDAARKVRIGIAWGLWEAVNKVRVQSAKQSPSVTIEATDIHCSDDYSAQVRNRALDVAFARPPFDMQHLETAPLYQERILAVLSEDNPLASRKSLRIRELAKVPLLLWDKPLMPFVYDRVLELYARAQVTPKMIPTPGAGPNNHAGLMMVASGKGAYVCIGIPATSQHPASGVVLVPISDAQATIDICVAWRRGETSPLVTEFLKCVWHVFPQERRAPARRAS